MVVLHDRRGRRRPGPASPRRTSPLLSADVRIVSHVLEESMRTPETGYPPRERVLKLAYDRGAQLLPREEGVFMCAGLT